jgi:hypothetical protein
MLPISSDDGMLNQRSHARETRLYLARRRREGGNTDDGIYAWIQRGPKSLIQGLAPLESLKIPFHRSKDLPYIDRNVRSRAHDAFFLMSKA